MTQRLIHGTLCRLGEFHVFEIVSQHKQPAGQQKCPFSLSSLLKMSVQRKESFFFCCPPHCSLFIFKEVEEVVGHSSVYCKLWKTCHNENSGPRKKTGSHLEDCRLKMAKCSWPQKEALASAETSDQNAQNVPWQLEPGKFLCPQMMTS